VAKSGAEKIGVKAGCTLTLVGAPGGDAAVLGAMPEDVEVVVAVSAADLSSAAVGSAAAGPGTASSAGAAGIVLLFAADSAQLHRDAPPLFAAAGPATKLWIAYRKGAVSDIGRDTLMPAFVDLGWHGVSLVSLDETWSAARFRRLEEIGSSKG
jgi:hypothetical protein